MADVELLVDAKATLGEGPCWDHENQTLYWVDIEEGQIFIYDPEAKMNRKIQLDQMPGAIVPRKSGGVIAALENGFYSINLVTEEREQIHDPESHLPGNRFNDGKCDPAGRFWAGTIDEDRDGNAALYCLDTDLSVTKKIADVSNSNGLVWSLDSEYFYYIDTPTQKVVRYEYDRLTGGIQKPKDVIFVQEEEGKPDGMTIDADNMLWIAHWGGSKVSRWNPVTGEKMQEITVPACNVTSCTFGGKDLNELFITTARKGMDKDQLETYPNAGGLFKVTLNGVNGIPSPKFGG
ncbi:SMP-30/gluconolactonase/LRE family protein [Pseudalkalibacillus salsuginis]|uniref:SMP-30/gluconolactonase/LRE family protein n=1 Tax=Pseudalkalibacillus salsuginis TaxID=2910972 RepID=UPI001F273702|nr:SMP-30/gluconolactonase/LRE family protein [Pseudalkalibacillus salsuginis]MCF6409923.1 SMP-30/gluconolactonase/LRE family protein [Pseudalkalibacillus salsuginis]